MSDATLAYTLDPPNLSAITFNINGLRWGDGQDGYFVQKVRGLAGVPLRTPNDSRPQTHGGLIHPRKKGPRPINFEGRFYVQTVKTGNGIALRWEQMEDALLAVLDDLDDAPGTLSYTTRGGNARSLEVWSQIPLETDVELGVNPGAAKTYTFGLMAADPSLA
jgi:hypothetical protein